MSGIEKSTWLLLDNSDKLKLISSLLDKANANSMEDRRSAKKQLLEIINWLDEEYE